MSEAPYREYSNEEAYAILQRAHTDQSPSQFGLEIKSILLFGRDIFKDMEKEANQKKARQRRAYKQRRREKKRTAIHHD